VARILQLQWPDLAVAEINSFVHRAVGLDDVGAIDEQSPMVASDHLSALDNRSESLLPSSQESGVSTQSPSVIGQLAMNPHKDPREIEVDLDEGSFLLHSVPYINWWRYVSFV